jgi:hypothetical protein
MGSSEVVLVTVVRNMTINFGYRQVFSITVPLRVGLCRRGTESASHILGMW